MKDVNYYERIDSNEQQKYVNLQNNCVLCNSPLELKFETIESDEIKEEARCPRCDIRTRAKLHPVQ